MSFESNIKKMYGEFSEGQKHWFRFGLPLALHMWLGGDFNGKHLSKNPNLIEDYLDHQVSESAAYSAGKLDNFLLALWCIRKCYGPMKVPYALFRVTSLKEAHSKFKLTCSNSLKPITSWSTDSNVQVLDRNPTDADYVIVARGVPQKNLLCTMKVVEKFFDIVIRNAAFFGLNVKESGSLGPTSKDIKRRSAEVWKATRKDIAQYIDEDEHFIYLNKGDHINAEIYTKIEHKKGTYLKKVSKIKIGLTEPIPEKESNPFDSPLGGMNKFTPQEQMDFARQGFEKMQKSASSKFVLEVARSHLLKLEDYAKRHNMNLK